MGSEIFSTSERDRAMSFAVFTQYNANAVLLYLVPIILNAFHVGGTMLFFAAFNILNFAFVFAYVKETKGLPLEAIPILFDSKADLANLPQEQNWFCIPTFEENSGCSHLNIR